MDQQGWMACPLVELGWKDGSIPLRKHKHRPIKVSYKIQNLIKSTYWFVQKYTTQEIVEHLADFWVALNILFVRFNKLIFTDRKVLKNLIIKVYFA
jgi:hypothetical protein